MSEQHQIGRIALAIAAAAFGIIAAGCIIEAPYTSDRNATPVSVTLTAAEPVAVLDVAVDRAGLPPAANVSAYQLWLRDVDPRVRLATVPHDIDNAGGPAATLRPSATGDLYVELSGSSSGETRVILQLTDPRVGDAVTVAGTLEVPFGYPGTPAPDAHVSVTGLDAAQMRGTPDEKTVVVTGPRARLDAGHPVVLVPVTFALKGGNNADPLELASETQFALAPDIPKGAVVPSLYTVSGDGADARMVSAQTGAPMAGCQIAPGATCKTSLMLRWQWTGRTPSVDLRYDVVTTLVSFGGTVDSTVETTFGNLIEVPADARSITATHEGSLDTGVAGRAEAWFRLRLDGTPRSPGSGVLEVPGVLLLTYSARGKDGRTSAETEVPLHFRDVNFFRPTPAEIPEVLDLTADGDSRTIAIPIFAHCQPAADCTLDFWLELFPPRGRDVGPVSLDYRFDARATTFAGIELAPDAALILGPKPSEAP